MSKGNSVIVRCEQVFWKVQRTGILGKSLPSCFIEVWNMLLSFSVLHVPCIFVAVGVLSCIWLPMLCFSGVGNESRLTEDFMRKLMCVKPSKKRLSERLSTWKEESLMGGWWRKICCYMLLVSMCFHCSCFRCALLVLPGGCTNERSVH